MHLNIFWVGVITKGFESISVKRLLNNDTINVAEVRQALLLITP